MNRLQVGLTASAIAVLISLGASSAQAVGTLDQSVTGTSLGLLTVNSVQPVAQSFTAGLSGQLDRVTLSLMRNNTPNGSIVEIRTMSGSTPSTTVLASQSLPDASVPTTMSQVSIDFSAPATVVAGTQYAIVLRIPVLQAASNSIRWAVEPGNPLATGTNFSAITWNELPGYDLRFATYVTVPSTPTPTPSQTSTPTPTQVQGASAAIASSPPADPAALASTGIDLRAITGAAFATVALGAGALIRRRRV